MKNKTPCRPALCRKFAVPIFDGTVHVVIGGKCGEAKTLLEKKIGSTIDEVDPCLAFTSGNGKTIGVWFGEKHTDPSTIAHESHHVLCRLFDGVGEGNPGEEIAAYLSGFINEKIHKIVKEYQGVQ